ncbi:hypothetical protein IE81DRAFT_348975 [Ceraceosorus guamensis]|uniref:Uncharacterized protein n=1 Tax=Ceraceosorus guamensis TaxID=1522189 RepID=A0A316VU50_9BASI|nr:hypothetical protein IE81DRAFT_348975 [Ceraceosorus guamensis]PWN40754.1 hypothetical protein IE81DRAFT_348975 [Ceraceosorus guamensis]
MRGTGFWALSTLALFASTQTPCTAAPVPTSETVLNDRHAANHDSQNPLGLQRRALPALGGPVGTGLMGLSFLPMFMHHGGGKAEAAPTTINPSTFDVKKELEFGLTVNKWRAKAAAAQQAAADKAQALGSEPAPAPVKKKAQAKQPEHAPALAKEPSPAPSKLPSGRLRRRSGSNRELESAIVERSSVVRTGSTPPAALDRRLVGGTAGVVIGGLTLVPTFIDGVKGLADAGKHGTEGGALPGGQTPVDPNLAKAQVQATKAAVERQKAAVAKIKHEEFVSEAKAFNADADFKKTIVDNGAIVRQNRGRVTVPKWYNKLDYSNAGQHIKIPKLR